MTLTVQSDLLDDILEIIYTAGAAVSSKAKYKAHVQCNGEYMPQPILDELLGEYAGG